MRSGLRRLSTRRHAVLTLFLITALGCGAVPDPVIAPPAAPSATPEPPAPSLAPVPTEPPFVPPAPPMPTLTPTPTPSVRVGGSGGGAAPAPAPAPTPLTLTAPIQPFFVGVGETLSFSAPSGQALITAVSALSYQPSSPAFQLSLGPSGQAYTIQQAPAAATPPITWPFRPVPPLAPRPRAERHLLQDAPSEPRTLGSEATFRILTSDAPDEGPVEQTAVLHRISEHAYYYVDTAGLQLREAHLDEMVETFESRIYPRLSEVFGEVARPGVDGDDRIFLVFSPAVHDFGQNPSLLGYFSPQDAMPPAYAGPDSNQKEVLFISDLVFRTTPLLRYGVIAHELQHLINFSQKGPRLDYQGKEALWLDEGLSMYAMDVAGFGLESGAATIAQDIRSFQERPQAYSLTEWRTNPNGYAYGQAYLFVRYMVDRHGEAIVPEILGSQETGLAGLDTLLRARQDHVVSFFRAWTTANLISGLPLAADTPYNYGAIDLRGTYGGVTLPGITPTPVTDRAVSAPLRPWGSAYYRWMGSDDPAWRFTLSPGAGTPLSGSLIAPHE